MRYQNLAIIIAEVVGIFHLVLAILIAISGEFLDVFGRKISDTHHPGLDFVLNSIDYPVHSVAASIIDPSPYRITEIIFYGLFVILLSSFLYSFVGLFLGRILGLGKV